MLFFVILLYTGNYHTHQDTGENAQDMLSTSSLRRKLFFHGDQGTPLSPVKPRYTTCYMYFC